MSNGLAKLVLSLLETLRQLMENQARHRIDEKSLDSEEIERLGVAFMRLNQKIGEIAKIFNLSREELNLGISPGGNLLTTSESQNESQFTTLADILDRVIEKGVVVLGNIGLSVAEVDLVNVDLRLALSGVKHRNPGLARKRVPIAPREKSRNTKNARQFKVKKWRAPADRVPLATIFGKDSEILTGNIPRHVRKVN